ncbi:hypothetical protein Tco_1270640, partial [Tanacetum coccineum]
NPVAFKAPKTSSKDEKKSKIDAANNVYSSKGDIGSTTGYSKKKKKSSSAKDSNPSQPLTSTPMVTGLHKEAQRTTGSPTPLGVTNEERANPQLTSVVSVSTTKPIFSASTIIHSESASGHDASAASTPEVDPEQSAPSDSVSKQQGASVPDPLSPKSIEIQELSTQLLLVKSLNSKLVKEKEVAETEAAILKAQPSFLNVEQLTKLLVQSLKHELSKLLTSHDFNNSLPSELKELPSKFKDIIGEIRELKRYVEGLEIEIPGDLKALLGSLELFLFTIKSYKHSILDALPSLLNSVTKALDSFAQAIEYASHKAGDQSVPSASQAGTHPAEGEKNIRQATIT